MTNRYYCPHCEGLLNPGTKVIFVIERGSDRGLILLSPELGDYAVVLAESVAIVPGVLHRLRCPVCQDDLTSNVNQNLVEILCREPDGTRSRVNFSRVGGERATFVRGPDGVQSFGDHAERYSGVNFFGVGKNGGFEEP